MTLGEKIKELRIKKGFSQEQLANMLNTTKQAIYKYENGIVTNIPLEKIELISTILETTPAYLMGWEAKEPTETNDGLSDKKKDIISFVESIPEDKVDFLWKLIRTIAEDN
jgi:transcriptional regulator with XRE-family HTH domain